MHCTSSITPTTKALHLTTILVLIAAMTLSAAMPRTAIAATLAVTTPVDALNHDGGIRGALERTQSQIAQDIEVGFAATSFRVRESVGTATITATLSSTATQTVTVRYATRAGTADVGTDYTPVTGTLTLAPGTSAITFTVPISDDTVDEPNETLRLTLSAPTNAKLGRATATLTIIDDDAPPQIYTMFAPLVRRDLTVEFSAQDYRVDERAGTATITATLSSTASQTVTVRYATGNGTASAASDYTRVSGALTLAPGTRVITFTVPITDDKRVEPDETVLLTLSNPANTRLGSIFTATLTIVSDEPPLVRFSAATYQADERAGAAAITATLSHTLAQTVTVRYATGTGTASAVSDYTPVSGTLTFAPGTSAATFTVPISDDTAVEPNETLRVTLSAPTNATLGSSRTATVTIVNDDLPRVGLSAADYSVSEQVGAATITATLSSTFPQTVTVDYATSDGTARANSDYSPVSGTLTLAPGTRAITFTVPISDDTVIEPDETVAIMLSNSANAILGSTSAATLTIMSDDLPQVGFAAASFIGQEQNSAALITVTLASTSQQTITVDFATGNGTAQVGSDYTPVSGTLTFAPGSSTASLVVPIINDTVIEPDETVVLTLHTPSNAMLGTIVTTTLTIISDDVLPPGSTLYLPIITMSESTIAPTGNIALPMIYRGD